MLNQCYYIHTSSSPSFVVVPTEYMPVGHWASREYTIAEHSNGHCARDHTHADKSTTCCRRRLSCPAPQRSVSLQRHSAVHRRKEVSRYSVTQLFSVAEKCLATASPSCPASQRSVSLQCHSAVQRPGEASCYSVARLTWSTVHRYSVTATLPVPHTHA